MAALIDVSDALNLATGGGSGPPEVYWFNKDNRVTGGGAAPVMVSGRIASLWSYMGIPADGAVPSGSSVCTRSTTGAMLQADPGGGRQKWCLGSIGGAGLTPGGWAIYDRLAHYGGGSGTSTSTQNVNTPALTRWGGAAAAGNQMWIEIHTQVGATVVNLTVTYTNQAGTAGRISTPVQIGGAGLREQTRMIQVPFQAGDTGVRSIESFILSASTLTAGNIGFVIARPILFGSSSDIGIPYVRDMVTELPPAQEVLADACLALMYIANSTTAPTNWGMMAYVEK